MHRPITQTLPPLINRIPILRVLTPIRPITRILSPITQCRLAAIVRQFNRETPSSRQIKEIARRRREGVAASIVLEPPVALGEVVEWVYGCVGVGVVTAGG